MILMFCFCLFSCLLGRFSAVCIMSLIPNLFHAVAGVDYIQDTTTFTFPACEPIMCGTLRALDDCVLEEDETFSMTLEISSGQDLGIRIDRGRGVVTIEDQDSI